MKILITIPSLKPSKIKLVEINSLFLDIHYPVIIP